MKSFKLIGIGAQKVLLFPGLMGTKDAFDPMLKYADLERFQYAAVDYRGYGCSKPMDGLFTLREAVVDACKLVEFLGWKNIAVGGHSLGALVAQMLAAAMPHRTSAIVSIAGVSAKGPVSDPARAALMAGAATSAERRQQIVKGGTANRCSDAFAQALVAATFAEISPAAFAGYANDASRTDIREQVKELPHPVLAMVGEFDPACSEQAARETTATFFKQVEIQVIRGASHYPLYEAPAETIASLERFVSKHVALQELAPPLQLGTNKNS
ncbi:alpha/beta hydrolase [Paraburkholderia xenovorans]|uniref:alpha/beta fold hydrolase n=1 Tax=Paraburkholderia xenovorans TaxID=36873 RepID=UPI0038BAFE35